MMNDTPKVIDTRDTQDVQPQKRKRKPQKVSSSTVKGTGNKPGRPVDWKKRIAKQKEKEHKKAERKQAREDRKLFRKLEKDRKRAEKKQLRQSMKIAKKHAKEEEKRRRKEERHRQTLLRRQMKKEELKRAKEEFFEDLKDNLENLRQWVKEEKVDTAKIQDALGDIKGLKITKTGRISRSSDVRSPLLKKTLAKRTSSYKEFQRALKWSKFSASTRLEKLKYNFRDLFDYFLDASELEDFGYSALLEKLNEAEHALSTGNIEDGEALLDEFEDMLVAAIDKAMEITEYRPGEHMGWRVSTGDFRRTKFSKTPSYDVTPDYDDFD